PDRPDPHQRGRPAGALRCRRRSHHPARAAGHPDGARRHAGVHSADALGPLGNARVYADRWNICRDDSHAGFPAGAVRDLVQDRPDDHGDEPTRSVRTEPVQWCRAYLMAGDASAVRVRGRRPGKSDQGDGMAEKNSDQVADWNGQSGERWVAYQARLDAMLAVFGQAAIEAAAPATGERVLDVGCGAGASSLALAARVGAG